MGKRQLGAAGVGAGGLLAMLSDRALLPLLLLLPARRAWVIPLRAVIPFWVTPLRAVIPPCVVPLQVSAPSSRGS